jgi:hypothetical protein
MTATETGLEPNHLVLARSRQGFHFYAQFRPALEPVTFEAISSELFDEVGKRWDDDFRRIAVAIYAASLFGETYQGQNRSAIGYFKGQARKIGYSILNDKVYDLSKMDSGSESNKAA